MVITVNGAGEGSMGLRQFVKGSEFKMATFLSVAACLLATYFLVEVEFVSLNELYR